MFAQLEKLVLVKQPELLGSEDEAYDVVLPPELPGAVPLLAATNPSRYLVLGCFELLRGGLQTLQVRLAVFELSVRVPGVHADR